MNLSGKISWFGGPQDPSAQGTPASGIPITQPGIAVNNAATLKGWWLLKLPNDELTMIQQTDRGPAAWTGRAFDFTYSALPKLGYTQQNFPTDANVSGVYLGKSQTEIARNILPAAQQLGANLPNIAGWLNTMASRKTPTFGVTPASGNSLFSVPLLGQFDTGGIDGGNKPVQPGGPSNVVASAGQAISDAVNTAVSDAKYAAVLVGVLLLGGLLMLRAFSTGGGKTRPVPVPV